MHWHPSQEHLVAYVGEEASPKLGNRIGAHLRRCAKCRQEFASIQALSERLRRVLKPSRVRATPSADLIERVKRLLTHPSEGSALPKETPW